MSFLCKYIYIYIVSILFAVFIAILIYKKIKIKNTIKLKTLITGALKLDDEKIKELKKMGLDITFLQDEKESINFENFEFVICNNLFLYHDIKLFKNLKYIQLTSAGLDRVPLDYISNNKIKLFNAKGVYSIPMAEWVICKILDVYKNSFNFYDNQKNHTWEKYRNILELNNKNVTIIGFGSVGKEINKRLKGFGVNVFTINMKNFYKLNEYLEISDITIITLPLTKETENLFNKELFKIMKEQSILINVSRGRIINTHDLIEYKEKFLKIILDVFEEEPLNAESELWNLDDFIVTPHNSFVGEFNNERLFELIEKNLKEEIFNEKNFGDCT